MVVPWASVVVPMKAEVRVGPSCCWSRLTLFWLISPLLVAAASLLATDWMALLAVTAWKATSPPLMMAVAMIGMAATR